MINTSYLYIYWIILVVIVGVALLLINYYLSTKDAYNEKLSPFECGLYSFNQTRSSYSVGFILIAILFLPFDLEISSILPYSLVLYFTNSYGLMIMVIFVLILLWGFYYELKNNALKMKKEHIKTLVKRNL